MFRRKTCRKFEYLIERVKSNFFGKAQSLPTYPLRGVKYRILFSIIAADTPKAVDALRNSAECSAVLVSPERT